MNRGLDSIKYFTGAMVGASLLHWMVFDLTNTAIAFGILALLSFSLETYIELRDTRLSDSVEGRNK